MSRNVAWMGYVDGLGEVVLAYRFASGRAFHHAVYAYREDDPGKYVSRCPVCHARLQSWCDRSEGTVLESTDTCGCGLYHAEFAYGGYQERIGYVTDYWSYRDYETRGWEESRRERWTQLVVEARRLLNDWGAVNFHADYWNVIPADPFVRHLFSEWLEENHYPLNAKELSPNEEVPGTDRPE